MKVVVGMMQPGAKGTQVPLEAGHGEGRASPGDLEGAGPALTLLTPPQNCLQNLQPPDCERGNTSCFAPLGLWSQILQPQETSVQLISGGGMGGVGESGGKATLNGVSASQRPEERAVWWAASLYKGPGAAAVHQRSRRGAEVPREEG